MVIFTLTCKRLKLIPHYINIQTKRKTIAAIKTKSQAETIWINLEIQFLYRKKQLIYGEIRIRESILFHSHTHSQLASLKTISCKKYNL